MVYPFIQGNAISIAVETHQNHSITRLLLGLLGMVNPFQIVSSHHQLTPPPSEEQRDIVSLTHVTRALIFSLVYSMQWETNLQVSACFSLLPFPSFPLFWLNTLDELSTFATGFLHDLTKQSTILTCKLRLSNFALMTRHVR